MSTFAVTIEKINKVWEHDNADRLAMASLVGKDYQFVVGKDTYKPGEVVIYFPVDSLLPQWITDVLELTGKLAHGKIPDDGSLRLQNRVKTIRLRGQLSQGIVCSWKILTDAKPELNTYSVEPGMDFTETLGVEKYEPPVVPSKFGNLVKLPEMVGHYDIEGAQNYVGIVEDCLMGAPVYISEKVEGSHWFASIRGDQIIVGQRNYAIEPVEDGEHDWHKVLRTHGLDEILRILWNYFVAQTQHPDNIVQVVTVRGEMLGPGIQGNYYSLKDHEVKIFEIERNGIPIDASAFLSIIEWMEIPHVPILARDVTLREWLGGKSLLEASNGISKLNNKKREGIVIKPMVEQAHDGIPGGRLFIKQRSPEYLLDSEY